MTPSAPPRDLLGTFSYTPVLSQKDLEEIEDGKTVVIVNSERDGPPHIYMLYFVVPEKDQPKGFLIGEVDPSYLFGVGKENTLPPMTELCVLDENHKIIVSSLAVTPSFAKYVSNKTDIMGPRQFEWEQNGDTYLASWWLAFLKSRFTASNWTVVLSQSKSIVLAPLDYFKRVFPLVVLISIWVVLFLSIIQIRRNLKPLEQLKEGTQLIGQGLFDMKVQVESDDEFQELADSFNAMSSQLAKQFRTLKTMGEIDRAILSSFQIEKIVKTVLSRIPILCGCDSANMAVLETKDTPRWRLYQRRELIPWPTG